MNYAEHSKKSNKIIRLLLKQLLFLQIIFILSGNYLKMTLIFLGLIKDDKDFERHMDYIHYNPVKHGTIQSPFEWPFHCYIQKGIIQSNLAVKGDFDGCFGEV